MAIRTYQDHPNRVGDVQDMRSWSVRSRMSDDEIGDVKDVLLDERGQARYLEVELDENDRRVLLPIGHAVADAEKETLWLSGSGRNAFESVPDYAGNPQTIDSDYEHRVSRAWDDSYDDNSFYGSPHYRSESFRDNGRDEPGSGTLARVDSMDDVGVADYDHDPRGWTVVGGDGTEIGKVDHLIGDTKTMKVRYLVVDPDSDIIDNKGDVLVPIGHAVLDPDNKNVRVAALDRTSLSGYPVWTGDELSRDHERKVVYFFTDRYAGDRRYEHPGYATSKR